MLKRPATYLAAFLLLAALLIADTFRRPEKQITGLLYVNAVRIYQFVGRPILEGRIECRYQPTCSEFSIEAVQRHGIRKGLELTYHRLNSCQVSVPKGTNDPVPSAY